MKRFMSERFNCLVSTINNTLTVEDYCKWYSLYYINDSGRVDRILFVGKDYSIDGADHYVYPSSVVDYCLQKNCKIDYISYLAICYRYIEDSGMYIPEEHLPSRGDLEKVLVTDVFDEFGGYSHCDYYMLYPQHIKPEHVLEGYTK